jgi:hypothetical protein
LDRQLEVGVVEITKYVIFPSCKEGEDCRGGARSAWLGSDAIIKRIESCDESQLIKRAILKLLVLGPPLLLDPGRRYMEDRDPMGFGINKHALGLQFVTLSLLDGGTPLVVLRDKHPGGGRFGSKCEGCIELASIMVVTLGEIIVEDSEVGLVDHEQPVALVCGEDGLVDLDPLDLSQVGLGNKAVVHFTSVQSGKLRHWFQSF